MDKPDVLNRAFPNPVRIELATRINAACRMVATLCNEDFKQIPGRGNTYGKNALHFYIDRLLVQAVDRGFLPCQAKERRIKSNGYIYLEFLSKDMCWQVKKTPKKGYLPTDSSFRRAKSLYNLVPLDFGPEYQITSNKDLPFALVTYGHKNFSIEFIVIGRPTPGYTDWMESPIDITNIKVVDLEEKIIEENSPKLRDEYLRKISQEV
jgi:hypothetical protein